MSETTIRGTLVDLLVSFEVGGAKPTALQMSEATFRACVPEGILRKDAVLGLMEGQRFELYGRPVVISIGLADGHIVATFEVTGRMPKEPKA